jgi:hypothetical protein
MRLVCCGKLQNGNHHVEFNLDRAFESYFGADKTPTIVDMAFSVSVSNESEGGKATVASGTTLITIPSTALERCSQRRAASSAG